MYVENAKISLKRFISTTAIICKPVSLKKVHQIYDKRTVGWERTLRKLKMEQNMRNELYFLKNSFFFQHFSEFRTPSFKTVWRS